MRMVGLLRGVNVGGNNVLKMADLRAVTESLGHTAVATYLQSGNVVFDAATDDATAVAQGLMSGIHSQLNLKVHVHLRTADEMAAIVANAPYQRDDPTKLVVTFGEAAAQAPPIDVASFAPEGLAVIGREVYLDLPFGQGRSKLIAALAKTDDGTATSRNWRTVVALTAMATGDQ
jgi:uncharacterized protein (DUF1697 family)